MPLNIDWQQILLHLFNFVVLFAILYFLLYQPVKSFMEKRTAYYQAMDDKVKENLADAEKVKAEYAHRLQEADAEIAENKKRAQVELARVNADKLKRAQEEAAKIIADAHRGIENERAKMLREAQDEIVGLAVSTAEKRILQSSTSESYDQFLQAVEGDETE